MKEELPDWMKPKTTWFSSDMIGLLILVVILIVCFIDTCSNNSTGGNNSPSIPFGDSK